MATRRLVRITAVVCASFYFWCEIVAGRTVPAIEDICNRLPQLSVCPQRSRTAADTNPVASSSRSNNGDDTSDGRRAEYCRSFQSNFEYYCLGDGKGERKAADFCPSYADICGKGAAMSESGPQKGGGYMDAQLRQICVKYQPIARRYCTGRSSEKGDVRENCDRYRSNCAQLLAEGGGGGEGPAPAPRQPTPGCVQYQKLYFSRCASQNPSTQQELIFCQNFAAACGPDDLIPQAGNRRSSPVEQGGPDVPNVPPPRPASASRSVDLEPPPSMAAGPMTRAVPSRPMLGSANPMAPVSGGGPMTVGSGTRVGNLAGVSQGTSVDPLSGVNTGKNVNAGPVAVSSGSGVNFGGLVPGLGGGGIPGLSGLGRRKRNVSYITYDPRTRRVVWYPSYTMY